MAQQMAAAPHSHPTAKSQNGTVNVAGPSLTRDISGLRPSVLLATIPSDGQEPQQTTSADFAATLQSLIKPGEPAAHAKIQAVPKEPTLPTTPQQENEARQSHKKMQVDLNGGSAIEPHHTSRAKASQAGAAGTDPAPHSGHSQLDIAPLPPMPAGAPEQIPHRLQVSMMHFNLVQIRQSQNAGAPANPSMPDSGLPPLHSPTSGQPIGDVSMSEQPEPTPIFQSLKPSIQDAPSITAAPPDPTSGVNAAGFMPPLASGNAPQEVRDANMVQTVRMQSRADTAPSNQIAPVLMRLTSNDVSRQISLQLTPKDLGRVEIHIDQAHSGPVIVHLTADNPTTLAALQRDHAQLVQALDRAGLSGEDRSISFHLAATHPQPFDAAQPGQFGSTTTSAAEWSAVGTAGSAPDNGPPGRGGHDHRRFATPSSTGVQDKDAEVFRWSVPDRPATAPILRAAGLNITA